MSEISSSLTILYSCKANQTATTPFLTKKMADCLQVSQAQA